VLGAPIVWSIQLEIIYALAAVRGEGTQLVIHLVTVISALLTAGGFALSFADWSQAGKPKKEQTKGGPIARTAFLGQLGMIVSLLFTTLILAQGLSGFFFSSGDI
jgi:hypothetical protein